MGTGPDISPYLLDQLGHDFGQAHSSARTKLYSFGATDPASLMPGGNIITQAGRAAIVRPDGSPAGIAALEENTMDPGTPSTTTRTVPVPPWKLSRCGTVN